MSSKAKAIQTLYRANRITIDGVRQAVADGVITEYEYFLITGEQYPHIEPEEPIIPDIPEEEPTEEPIEEPVEEPKTDNSVEELIEENIE